MGAAFAGHITVGAADDLSDPAGFVSAGAFVDVARRPARPPDKHWPPPNAKCVFRARTAGEHVQSVG